MKNLSSVQYLAMSPCMWTRHFEMPNTSMFLCTQAPQGMHSGILEEVWC